MIKNLDTANRETHGRTSWVMVLAAYVSANLVSVLTVVLVTGEFETMPFAMLMAQLVLPLILAFVALANRDRVRAWAHVAYLLPASGLLAWLLVLAVIDTSRQVSDGSGALAALSAIVFGTSALIAYLILWRTCRQRNDANGARDN